MNYYLKYIKYKNKYLKYKKSLLQIGGDKPLIKTIKNINLFTDERMEEFMNPVYGFFMCECGYITNNYYLDKIDSSPLTKIINKITKDEDGFRRPVNEIKDNLNSRDIGRYIGLLYANSFYKIQGKSNKLFQVDKEILFDQKINDKKFNIILGKYINKSKLIRNTIFKEELVLQDSFHLLLYCLWWIANNREGIKDYYEGINEIFITMNQLELSNKIPLIIIPDDYLAPNSEFINLFEEKLYNLYLGDFEILVQEYSRHFCVGSNNPTTYPDCGEVTARNFMNLILYDIENNKFNTAYISKFEPIQELLDYYTIFNNFDDHKSSDTKRIYEQNLNSRDAWSYLILFYANKNINFKETCRDVDRKYELNSGMSIDRRENNFIQLIKNFLPGLNNLTDLKGINNIENIEDKTTNGYNNIIISGTYNIIITMESDHIYMKQNNKKSNIDLSLIITPKHKFVLDILLQQNSNHILNHNICLFIKWTPELISRSIKSDSTPELIKELTLIVSTDQFNHELRKRIVIDIDNEIYTPDFFTNLEINDFTYTSNNFNFIRDKIPALTNLNFKTKYHLTKHINLSSFMELVSIGNGFINGDGFTNYYCSELTSIILPKNLQSIGKSFMNNCNKLKIINLSNLNNLKFIDDKFMSNSNELTEILFSPDCSLQYIGQNFLYKCKKIKNLNLSYLVNLETLNNSFLSNCSGLTTIDLKNLTKLKTIGDNFLYECSNLTLITLSNLDNLISIGSDFLNNCVSLISLDLKLVNLQSIGYHFMYNCTNLTSLQLIALTDLKIDNSFLQNCINLKEIHLQLPNLTLIPDNFLVNCTSLTNIDLDYFSNVTSIGKSFLYLCSGLMNVDLSPLSHVTSVGNAFLKNCTELTTIDLSPLSNVTSVGYDFLANCEGLTIIDLSPLSNLTSVYGNFLYNCTRLTTIDLSPFTNVRDVGQNFLAHCNNLEEIIFKNIKSNVKIDYFFDSINKLRKIKHIKCINCNQEFIGYLKIEAHCKIIEE